MIIAMNKSKLCVKSPKPSTNMSFALTVTYAPKTETLPAWVTQVSFVNIISTFVNLYISTLFEFELRYV